MTPRITPEREAALRALLGVTGEPRGSDLISSLIDALDDLRDLKLECLRLVADCEQERAEHAETRAAREAERARWQPLLDAWAAYEARPCHATEGGLQRALRKAVQG